MQLLTIRLFGELSAVDGDGNDLHITSKRSQAALIYLALRIADGGNTSELRSLLFGEDPTRHTADIVADLRNVLRRISPEILIDEGDSIRLNPSVVWVDTERFDRLVDRPSIHMTREATELYRANLLEGYMSGREEFDDWIAERRLNYWRSAVGVFGRLLNAQIKAFWWDSAVETASRLLALDPTQEVVHRTLMRLQLEQGRADAALRRYQECADILKREFARQPSAETERLRDEIRAELDRLPAPREVFYNADSRPVLILLVEDDLVTSALIEGFLTEADYEVIAVADGADALMEIGRRQFDLLILDINVPTLSGLRLFEIMIQKGIETPAVFVTGVAGAEAEARSLEMGAADFLRKPIRKENLLPRIRTILQRKTRAALKQSRLAP
ncbi:MAG TPA: response regulator [Thermoanaerobaculia bacterium]|nr:response regulator [Thermoanaerobaculia bacterium]